MKASIVFDPPTDRHLIYLWQEGEDGARVARCRDSSTGAPMRMTVPPGGELPIWAVWDSQEAAAITAALALQDGELLVVEEPDALADARAVRDRLLTLVEGMAANGRS